MSYEDSTHPAQVSAGQVLERSSARPSPLSLRWNRLCSWLRSGRTAVVYSPLYLVDLGTTPVDVQRAERILTFLIGWGVVTPGRILRPEPATLSDLRLAHSRRYLEALQQPEALDGIVGVSVWPDLHQQALLAQRAAVGGTVLATREALREKRTAINLGGGFHHAGRLGGSGYCIFDDVSVAIHKARRQGFRGPILVVDLDLHDGNGTRGQFADDETVFTFSLHNQHWDRHPALASLAIELEGEVDDARYLSTLREQLPPVIARVRPELVFYLAGTDPAADDRLGNWSITATGMLQRDRFVVSTLRRQLGRIPLVVLLAGGYGKETWRYSARFFAWLLTGRGGIEPPSTAAITLARHRNLTRSLRRRTLPEESSDDGWGLTESDVLGGLGLASQRPLFLGHYSHHALELTLEWAGVLDRLRQTGFSHPTLELDLDNPAGHTARLYGDSEHLLLLMELRLRIDRRTLPGMQMLSLEWLLLQNPRSSFSKGRRPLPGQRHPGLGLVPEVMSVLILISDQLQLDGIIFVPSHYHLALNARRFLRFLDAMDEGWFRSVQGAVEDLSLAEATRLIAAGRLRDRHTGEPVSWRPLRMVLPISDRLHDLVAGEDYERRAGQAQAEAAFDLPMPGEPTAAPAGSAATGSAREHR